MHKDTTDNFLVIGERLKQIQNWTKYKW
jgi:hypothetical protein